MADDLIRRSYAERRGGVAEKMSTEYFYKWIKNHITNDDLEMIVNAHGDTGKQLTILDELFQRAELPDSFVDDMYVNERKNIVKRLEDEAKMQTRFRKIIDKKDLGFTPGGEEVEVTEIPKETRVTEKEPTPKARTIRQRSDKGVYYERSYNKWSNKENLFLKSRLDDYKERKISMTTLRLQLKGISGKERSSSSVSTKMRRLKHEEKDRLS